MDGTKLDRLDDRVVVVTGASSGLGQAYARSLANVGARLVLTARRADLVTGLADELPHAIAVPGDVGSPGFADEVVSVAVESFGRIDVLVNNAGSVRDRTLLNMSDEEFDEVVRGHVYGTFFMARACAARMKSDSGGTIINIGSDSMAGAFGQTNYVAAKAAILGFTLTWAGELERFGITCNCVLPNALTPMTEGLPDLLEAYRYGGPERFPRELGEAAEVAPLILLLAGRRWGHLTGRIIGLGGDKLSLWSAPEEKWSAFIQGGWTTSALDRSFAQAFGEPPPSSNP